MSEDKKNEGEGEQQQNAGADQQQQPEGAKAGAGKAKEVAAKPQLVKATQPGYYGQLRAEGDTFEIANVHTDFSVTWMEAIDDEGKPLKKQPPQPSKK